MWVVRTFPIPRTALYIFTHSLTWACGYSTDDAKCGKHMSSRNSTNAAPWAQLALAFGGGATAALVLNRVLFRTGGREEGRGGAINKRTVLNPGRYDGATFMEDAPTASDRSTWYLVPTKPASECPAKDVLVSAPYLAPHLDRFEAILSAWNLKIHPVLGIERMEADMIIEAASKLKFDAVICGDDRYTVEAFQATAPNLKVVSKWGTGIDSIDCAAAKANGVLVGNTENAFSKPVADSTVAYILQFCRMQIWNDRMMKGCEWKKIPGRSLSECTVGVIGLGNVGKAVVERLSGFGCKVLGTDVPQVLSQSSHEEFRSKFGVTAVPLDTLCAEADFVCVCAQLTKGGEHPTFHLINRERLALMKPGGILINCARGPIVDEVALCEALTSQRIAGAALDVFEEEPLPSTSPLLRMDNVFLAPHNSNSSPTAHEAVHWSTIKNLLTGLGLPFVEQRKILADSRLR